MVGSTNMAIQYSGSLDASSQGADSKMMVGLTISARANSSRLKSEGISNFLCINDVPLGSNILASSIRRRTGTGVFSEKIKTLHDLFSILIVAFPWSWCTQHD